MRVIVGTIILGLTVGILYLVVSQRSCNDSVRTAMVMARDFTNCAGPAGEGCKTRGLEALQAVRTAKRNCRTADADTTGRLNSIERRFEQIVDR